MKWLDYSWARPLLTRVVADGYGGLLRYVTSDADPDVHDEKWLTPRERDSALNLGLDLALHGEDEAGAAHGGFRRGYEQGQAWADYAHVELDWPHGAVILGAVDYDTVGLYPAVVDEYLDGIEQGFGGRYQLGVYGSYWVIAGAIAAGRGAAYAMTDAWGPDQPPAGCHIHQHGQVYGGGADVNDILISPFGSYRQTLHGAWPIGGTVDTPTPAELAAAIMKYPTTDTIGPGNSTEYQQRVANGMQQLFNLAESVKVQNALLRQQVELSTKMLAALSALAPSP